MKKKIINRIFIILFLSAFFFLVLWMLSHKTTNVPAPYYAVFLTNGQVYFGHLEKLDDHEISLHDVYYLRANTNLQNSQNLNSDDPKKETNVELALIKLGNELHGPKDMMMINRASILFWEELREDGRVVQAIKRHSP